jgi:S-(hydroxymethyl)glutathione dehydrogenase/alcohol dehydrogenase
MLVNENSLVKIDPTIPFDRAALVGCAVPTGLGAVMRSAKVPAGANVAVIGCGGVGLNVIQGAVLSGVNRIIAIDINDGKLATAKRFGATDLINNSNGDAIDQVNDLLPGLGGVDYSFEVLGLRETYELSFALLRPGGTATVIGIPKEDISLPAGRFLQERKMQGCSMGSVQFRKDLPFFIDLYLDGRLKLDELVSSRITLDQINEGYAAITDGSVARTVVVFD